jgi:glutamyl-tRNA synthetase
VTLLVTRIAPTPSGYLHVGNAVNFVLSDWLARAAGGRLLLRIDDFDTGRARPEYLADIIDTIAWLGLRITDGPRAGQDLSAWSMAGRTERFRAVCARLLAEHPGRVFACRCSRRELDPSGWCVAGCARRGLAPTPGQVVVRLHVPEGEAVSMPGAAGVPHGYQVPPGDHVLWRRDDLPAYQLGSVVADEDLGVTAVVRGIDLLESSALQRHLAGLLPAPGFLAADLRHHSLLRGPSGDKLSKSAGHQALPMLRTDSLLERIHGWATELGAPIGITPPR